ncbi:MAG TPA: BON domain-containing protein [Pirellulales bacterium]|jgi:osmotically-inducible protein OsmY
MADEGVPSVAKLAAATEVVSIHRRASLTLPHRLRRCFRASPYTVLHDIECDCQEGAVTLRGEAASFFLKQVAQELARKVQGVERITNRIDVVAAKPHRNGRQEGDC